MTKMVVNRKPIGERRKGTPRQKSLDDILENLQMMNIRNWKRIVK